MTGARKHGLFAGVMAAFLGLFLLLAAADSAQAQARKGTAEVTKARGRVELRRLGQTQWIPLSLGAKVSDGDEVRAFANASAELKMPDASTLLVAENTRIVVAKLEYDAQNRARLAIFHLAIGKIRVTIARAAIALVRARQSNYIVSTPTGVAAARGTDWVVAFNGTVTFVGTVDGSVIYADIGGAAPRIIVAGTFITHNVTTGVITLAISITTLSPAAQTELGTATNTATAGSPILVIEVVGLLDAEAILGLLEGEEVIVRLEAPPSLPACPTPPCQ